MEERVMTTAVNDATLNQAGTIYQYLIALKDCFELKTDDTLQIETNGDVSIVNSKGGLFQKEVKHHFGYKTLSDRDIDFWKTLANWYEEYDRVKDFSNYILSTTAQILNSSTFSGWNELIKEEKLKRIKSIGVASKAKEGTFRKQYDRIFNSVYSEEKLLQILNKFTIESSQTTLDGISREFSKYIGHIPEENRDAYIGALLGEILIKVKEPPHKWEVTKDVFEQILQKQSSAYGVKGAVPLPKEYAKETIPKEKIETYEQKKFIEAIREIKHDVMIPEAISDYWKTDMTIVKYFQNNLMYLESLDEYTATLATRMGYTKSDSEIDADGAGDNERIKISKKLYNGVMQWDAKDFGTIIRNQDFFQHGIIHNIVDETDFRWKVGEDKDEHNKD